MEKQNNNSGGFLAGILVGAFVVGLFFAFIVHAFNGPGCSAGSNCAAIGVDTSNDISVGTSSPISGTKTLIVGSTTDSSAYALKIQQSNAGPLLYIRNDGALSIATATVTAGTVTIQGNLVLSGTLTTGGSVGTNVDAGNVTPDVFNSLQSGGGNYTFPGSLGVNTSSQAGLPDPLSVYGAGYFTGDVISNNVLTSVSDTFIGEGAGSDSLSAMSQSVAVGPGVLISANGNNNTAVGFYAMNADNGGFSNVAIGNTALENAGSAFQNVAVGDHSLFNDLIGGGNVAIGFDVGYNANPIESTTLIGYQAEYNGSTERGTVAIGYQAGYNDATGSNNVFIGPYAGYNEVGSNKLYIDNASDSLPLIYGDFFNNLVGINTSSPSQALSVQGNIYASGNITCGGSCGGGGGVTGGQNNYIPLWTSGTTLGTSSLQANGTTTYTLNGFAIGTSTAQTAGNIFITGNYEGGSIAANQVVPGLFGSGSYAFPSSIGVNTSTQVSLPANLSVYGSTLITGASTLGGAATLNGTATFNATATFAGNVSTTIASSLLKTNASGIIVAASHPGDYVGSITVTTSTLTYTQVVDSTTTVVNDSGAVTSTFYSYTVPANTLGTAGKTYRITMQGTYISTSPAAGRTLTLYLNYGGQTIATKASGAIATSSSQGAWQAQFLLTNASGTTNNQVGSLSLYLTAGTGAVVTQAGSGVGTVNSGSSQTLTIWAGNSGANATTTVDEVTNELIGATTTVVTSVTAN